jgi:dipeptidyl aminopeptidase/acylaminoacyl peptidase
MTLVGSAGKYTAFREAVFADWHPSKREMAITTRFAEVPQLHFIASPNGARQQLTFLDDQIPAARFDLEGDSIVFLKDENGDEHNQIYRYELSTRRIRLTTDGKSRNWLGAWSTRDGKLAYTSTKRDGKNADLWMMNPDDARTNRLFLQLIGAGWRALDWSPDDSELLLLEEVSPEQSNLWLVNVTNRERIPFTPEGAEKISLLDARFSKDGKGIYAITKNDSRCRRLAYIDSRSKRLIYLTDENHINEFGLSASGARIAFVTITEDFSRLHVIDSKTGTEIAIPQPPGGVIRGMRWRGDEEIGFSLSTARSPNDCYSIDLATGKLERWTVGESALQTDSFSEPEFVAWKSRQGTPLSGHLYKPPPKFWGKRPVLVMIRADGTPPGFVGRNNYFLNELGIALFYPSVENWPMPGKSTSPPNDAGPSDAYSHLGALLDWIATRSDLDSGHVAVMGQFGHNHTALEMAKRYPERIRCAIDSPDNFAAVLGAEVPQIEHAGKIALPVLVVAGQNDPLVPASESQEVVSGLKRQGASVWLLLAKDEGHGFRKKWNQDFQFYTTILFLERYLMK